MRLRLVDAARDAEGFGLNVRQVANLAAASMPADFRQRAYDDLADLLWRDDVVHERAGRVLIRRGLGRVVAVGWSAALEGNRAESP